MNDAHARLLSAIRSGRAPHTTLISSPDAAEARLCGRSAAAALLLCGEDALDAHPDYKEFLSSGLKVDDIRDFLASELAKRPFLGGARVIHFTGVKELNVKNQSILLQLLEEPPDNTYFLLSGNEAGLLPTVRSRAATVRLPAAGEGDIIARLREKTDAAELAARAAEGVFSRAEELGADYDRRAADITKFARFLTEETSIAAADKLPRERAEAKLCADDMLLFMADALSLKVGAERLRFPALRAWARRVADRFTRRQINCIMDILAAHRLRLDTNAGAGQAVDSMTAQIMEEICQR